MGQINIDDLQPGMVLAADVKDRNNRVLLSAGAEITEKHIRIFRMWGAISADVAGVDKEEIQSQAVAAIDPEALRQAENEMVDLFARTNLEQPAMKELFRIAVLRTARRGGKGTGHGK